MSQPKIVGVVAISVDGKIAARQGESDQQRREYGFGCEADQQHFESMLLGSDAVVLGGRTARAPAGIRPIRNDRGIFPPWIVLTRTASPIVCGEPEAPIWYIGVSARGSEAESMRPNDRVYPNYVGDSFDISKEVFEILKNEKFNRVMLLGGGEIFAKFLAHGLVDELYVTICPVLLGIPGSIAAIDPLLPNPLTMDLLSSRIDANHVFLRYMLQKK